MSEYLKGSLEEHKTNLEAIDYLTKESLKNLYENLVNQLSQALEVDKNE